MKKIALGLAAITLMAAPALAQTPLTFADVDTDANGESLRRATLPSSE